MFYFTYTQIEMETKQQQAAAAAAAFATPDREGNSTDSDATVPHRNWKRRTTSSSIQSRLWMEMVKSKFGLMKTDRKKSGIETWRAIGVAGMRGAASSDSGARRHPRMMLQSWNLKRFVVHNEQEEVLENDTIPSLCSTNSGPLERKKGRNHHDGGAGEKQPATAGKQEEDKRRRVLVDRRPFHVIHP